MDRENKKEKKCTSLLFLLFRYFVCLISTPLSIFFCLVISLSSVGTRSTCVCVCRRLHQYSKHVLFFFFPFFIFCLFPSVSPLWLELKFSQQLKHIPYNNIPVFGREMKQKKKCLKMLLRVPHSTGLSRRIPFCYLKITMDGMNNVLILVLSVGFSCKFIFKTQIFP